MLVINLRFCYILLLDKISLAGSPFLYEFEGKRCENKLYPLCIPGNPLNSFSKEDKIKISMVISKLIRLDLVIIVFT